MKKLKNVHPGEVLLEEFLKPLGLSQTRLARALGASECFWMGLQADYALEEARALLGKDLNRVPRLTA